MEPSVAAMMEIDQVPADFPVGFSLLTAGDYQYVAYYDARRQMTVASRRVAEEKWHYTRLPSFVGADSHNYVTMAVDDAGFLHLSGNMHCVPLIYFRSEHPWDATSLQQVPAMVGRDENRCTYPQFMRGPGNAFLFHYRTGSSGNGNEIYNVYDVAAKRWSRLLETPLTSGEGAMNAYMNGPLVGPDGYYHLCWVWRDTPDCATNHDLSYARSKDLLHWETVAGEAVTLPITIVTPGLVVDPIPVGGGIINGCHGMGFDADGRVVITYHKFDAEGNTQAYAARFEQGKWQNRQISNWTYRWYFSGNGSIPFEIHLGRAVLGKDGTMALTFQHSKHGAGMLRIDAATLRPLGTEPAPVRFPAHLNASTSPFPGMQVKWVGDHGKASEPGVRYVLRWETLAHNNDRPREGVLPDPSRLILYTLREPKPAQ